MIDSDGIRVANADDAPAVAAIYAPIVERTAISLEEIAPDANEMARRIATTLQRFPWLVATDAAAVRGYAYAGPHQARAGYRWSVNVSVYVAEDARRQGVGRALYLALLAILARQGLGMAYAGVTLPNASSVGLHESLGFEPVGVYGRAGYKHGAWHDVGWWQRAVRSFDRDVAEPIDFPRLRADLGERR